MTIGYSSALNAQQPLRASPRSCSPLCTRALSASSPHSPLFVFKHLRTLSFFGSQLSFVLPITCALFPKKQGVGGTFNQSFSLRSCLRPTMQTCRLVPSAVEGLADFAPPLPAVDCQLSTVGFLVTPFPASRLPRDPSRGVAKTSPLTPFPATLMQKQGGRESWPALSAVEGSYQPSSDPSFRYFLTSLLRFFFSLFQVQWKHPFPVITGENQ